jgi:X-X-X-Leu-X-X-Gly heptad repeat protein
MPTRDVRDFRAAVTRQLLGQDREIAGLKAGIAQLTSGFGELKTGQKDQAASLAEIRQPLTVLVSALPGKT